LVPKLFAPLITLYAGTCTAYCIHKLADNISAMYTESTFIFFFEIAHAKYYQSK